MSSAAQRSRSISITQLIEVEHGKPVQLNFYRDEEDTCSEELLPDFNIRHALAP